jgi:hypothetical protein
MTETAYEKTVKKRLEDDKKKLIATLKELPVILAACKRVNVARDTYYRWYREDSEFRRDSDEAISQGIEFISDMSETQLISLIREEKMPAIAMWLKHNRPRYGGKNVRRPITGVPELTPEEEKLFKEFLGPSESPLATSYDAK